MAGIIEKILRTTRRIAYPERCAGCERDTTATPGIYICNQCHALISQPAFLICPICKKRVVFGNRGGLGPHATCQARMPYFLISPAWYGNQVVQKIIREYKYRWFSKLREPLGSMLSQAIQSAAVPKLLTYLIVPIPLHPIKLRTRGFNQAEELAKVVSSELKLPIDAGILARTRFTRPQAKIKSWEKRKENISGVFTVTKPEAVVGKRILLIDDITTSGATLGEAACALKAAGAKIIIAATIARS